MDKKIVAKINESGFKFYFAFTGGGTGFISDFISFGGASKSLIGANVPYNQRAFDKFIRGQKVDKYASEEGARKLAVAAFQECLDAGVEKKWALGVGASCSVASTSPEREGRKHKIHVAMHSATSTLSVNIILKQGRSRAEEEELINNILYKELCFMTTGILLPPSSKYSLDWTDEKYDFNLVNAPVEVLELVEGKREIINRHPPVILDDTIVVYSGSWNPLHDGHKAIIAETEKILRLPVILELTVNNAEKGVMDFIDIEKREKQISGYFHVITNAPLARNKAALLKKIFPDKKIIFVVGYDTWERIWDKKYCLYNNPYKEEIFFRALGVQFLVFGRGKPFEPLKHGEELRIKEPRAENFSINISSTELRNNQTV